MTSEVKRWKDFVFDDFVPLHPDIELDALLPAFHEPIEEHFGDTSNMTVSNYLDTNLENFLSDDDDTRNSFTGSNIKSNVGQDANLHNVFKASDINQCSDMSSPLDSESVAAIKLIVNDSMKKRELNASTTNSQYKIMQEEVSDVNDWNEQEKRAFYVAMAQCDAYDELELNADKSIDKCLHVIADSMKTKDAASIRAFYESVLKSVLKPLLTTKEEIDQSDKIQCFIAVRSWSQMQIQDSKVGFNAQHYGISQHEVEQAKLSERMIQCNQSQPQQDVSSKLSRLIPSVEAASLQTQNLQHEIGETESDSGKTPTKCLHISPSSVEYFYPQVRKKRPRLSTSDIQRKHESAKRFTLKLHESDILAAHKEVNKPRKLKAVMKIRMVPLDESTKNLMLRNHCNPKVELKLCSSKTMQDVSKHMLKKWNAILKAEFSHAQYQLCFYLSEHLGKITEESKKAIARQKAIQDLNKSCMDIWNSCGMSHKGGNILQFVYRWEETASVKVRENANISSLNDTHRDESWEDIELYAEKELPCLASLTPLTALVQSPAAAKPLTAVVAQNTSSFSQIPDMPRPALDDIATTACNPIKEDKAIATSGKINTLRRIAPILISKQEYIL